ncbi:PRTRC genetic system protein E [Edaphobacter aggregans]|uniref:PRTRC genetic system protein E n=1 Tax=Edaphobacter aggregans TaxID=570835 RepID=A0A3R9WJI3_9BACT|nr:PRTRC system protein E [Edaphobacter aggregans]RSL18631.1 PRTRC genetic system protein E [Edaphobacter aggregans]
MFRELSPLLTRRSLVLTVSSIGEGRIRLTITPRPTDKDESREVIQPLAVEGTAEELDTDLAKALIDYTAEHLTLARSLEQVKANMEAALKEAKEEAAKKVADAKRAIKPASTKTAMAPAPEVSKPAPPSLFDAPKEPTANPSAAKKQVADDDEDDDSDIPSPGAAVQPSMFDTQSEENEILKEAFYGTDNDHAAA